jgi:GntR family phosphonate transport system transcriptional regulator
MDKESSSGAPHSTDATAWRRIADDLASRLVRGDYESGAALPPAQDLARSYGVHRHTVRQACLHLQELGLITIRRGAGAFSTGLRLPYSIGRRVRLRDNLRAFDLAIESRIVNCGKEPAGAALARELAIQENATVWRIGIVNSAGDCALSASWHFACATRLPDLRDRLAAEGCSFTAAFASYGIADYQRRSTHITARLPRSDEASLLGILPGDPLLATRSLDVTTDGAPLQVVEGVFRGDRFELRVETE